ncbi:MAG TPA: TolC family protein [Blastocatellia bacterium]|nr:TolC family protein [Blastocatellia bacterium]
MFIDTLPTRVHASVVWKGAVLFAFLFIFTQQTFAQRQSDLTGSPQTTSGPALRLQDLEQMALQNNPTLPQAEAAIRAAEGRRRQAGLLPNPVIGYTGEEFAFRSFGDKSEHLFFIEQTIPLGGKLSKSRNIFAQEKVQAEFEAAAQKQRVLNAVRMLYYEALGAQQLVEVRSQLAKLARDAAGVTGELFNVGQADRPDMLEIEVEAERAQLDLVMAENARDQVWQQLAALVGNPYLKPTQLVGNLEGGLPVLNQEAVLAKMLAESPEIKRAQAGIERARASLLRARAEPKPDLFVRGGFGYNREFLETEATTTRRRTGPEAQVEIGIRIPLFNRNQGGIASSNAERDIAERERQRVELSLRARLASSFRIYQNALRAAEQYERQIIPRAQRAYELYLTRFRQMAASYPQVLISQRTLFQVRAEYVRALVDAWQTATQIQGYMLNGGLEAPMGIGVESGSSSDTSLQSAQDEDRR